MSRMIVTGPSLTSSTVIRAPKTPVSTGTPRSRSAWQKCLVQRLRDCSGRRRLREVGPSSLLAFAIRDQRELADDERLAARVEERAVELSLGVLEDPQPRDLASEPLAVSSVVLARDAEQDADPGADLAAGRDARLETRWTTALTRS